jgi:hypothetical protein
MRSLPSLALLLCAGIAIAADTPQQLADQALQQSKKVCQSLQTSQQCHTQYASGCGKTANSDYDPYLNFFKNQLVPPTSQPTETLNPQKLQTLEAGTPPKLVPNNHSTFSSQFVQLNEGEIVQATGYLYYAQQTGAESCNCERSGAKDSDFHIGLGFDASKVAEARTKPTSSSAQFHDLQSNSMIVEITPYYRAKNEPGWTLAKLEALYGTQVKVVGQLIADNDHYATGQDCGMTGADASACWRMSIWEIHPVTSFYVCTAGADCSSNDSGWTKLEDWTAPASPAQPHSRKKHSSAQ